MSRGFWAIALIFATGLVIGEFVGTSQMGDLEKIALLVICGVSFAVALRLMNRVR